eukprot:UN19949
MLKSVKFLKTCSCKVGRGLDFIINPSEFYIWEFTNFCHDIFLRILYQKT